MWKMLEMNLYYICVSESLKELKMDSKVCYSEKGLFAASNISVGETVYESDGTLLSFDTMLEKLHANGYPYTVSHAVAFTPIQMEGCPPILKALLERKRSVVVEKIGKTVVPALYLKYALILRSHGFHVDDKWHLDENIHYLNRSSDGNLDYKFDGKKFKLVTIKYISKGCECKLGVEGLNNYWSMLHYGRLISNPYLDVYFGTMELPQNMRTNLDYTKFNDKFEYQLTYHYSANTLELFSLFRFLLNDKESAKNCPSQLANYRYSPKDLSLEVSTLNSLKAVLKKINFNVESKKFKDFVKTEENIVKRWLTIINDALLVLTSSSFSVAKKRYKKLPCEDYHQKVVALFLKKKNFS